MKRLLVSMSIILFFLSGWSQAQNRLSESKQESSKSYVYTISRDNLREIHLKDKPMNEDMLGQCLAEFMPGKEKIPELPTGNYVIVKAIGNQLDFIDYTIDDLYFKVVPSEEMMLCLYDSLGRFVEDAIVKSGSKTLKYNKVTQTYNIKSIKDEAVLEVNNRGVYHYIEINKQDYNYYTSKKNMFPATWGKIKRWWYSMKEGTRNLFNKEYHPIKYKYTGFVVFSKPKYKPGETVKLKAYVSEADGKPYNKPVDIKLSGGHYSFGIDTVLANLKPYRPGMYEYQFKLTDSLELKLDTHYNVELKTPNKYYNSIRGQFRYEDYELKSIHFSMKTDKDEYLNKDSVKIKFKVTDENDMAVYGGKINVKVLSQSLQMEQMKNLSTVFVPDTLWTHTVDMGEKAQQELILPDSVFPPDVSLHYLVISEYLSVDNEKRTEQKRLYRKAEDYAIDFSLNKGILTIKELYKGKPQSASAYLELCGENGEVLSTDSIILPHTLPVPWMVADVTVKTKHTTDFYFLEERGEQLGYSFYRANDSIHLIVDNPANIPFWYTIRKNKKEVARGYTTNLNFSMKDKEGAGYAMQLSYLFGEEIKRLHEQLPFVQKNISMEVSTPSVVYPGQKTDVVVSVTDRKGKPVDNVDITAYSFTSKFKDYRMPDIAVKGKANYARPFNITPYEPDENGINQKEKMTWDRWKQTMSLDTIEYYKFLYPESYYMHTEPSDGLHTFISPYIVIDGALQGVNMLWIDGRLYYSDLAEQFNNYIFPVEPGRHTLRFRTYDRDITVHNLTLKAGTKNILSFNAAKPYASITEDDNYINLLAISSKKLDKKEIGKLTEEEIRTLTDQLITIDNNFGWIRLPNLNNPMDVPAYISSGHMLYYLNPEPRRRYDYRIKGPVNYAVLTGPFPSRNYMHGISDMASVYANGKLVTHIGVEGGNRYTVYPGYQKIKSWKEWNIHTINQYTPDVNFRQQPLTPDFIRRHFNQQLLKVLSTSTGIAEAKRLPDSYWKQTCRLNIHVGKHESSESITPALIFITPENGEEIAKYQLHYGGTRHFTQLPAGNMRISLIINDSISCSKTISLQPNGQNYLRFDSVSYDNGSEIAQAAFRIFKRNVRREQSHNPYQSTPVKDSIVNTVLRREEVIDGFPGNIVRGTVRDSEGFPVIGATVMIEGTTNGTITDLDGNFELSSASGCSNLTISYIGYQPSTLRYRPGHKYNITLNEDSQMLQEVVTIGYGVQKRTHLTGSVSAINVESSLAGKVPGIMIRGYASGNDTPPLILVNGLPYDGNINSIDPSQIVSMNILKDASATAIYGSRAANGVVMIETSALHASKNEEKGEEIPLMESSNYMRRNFHDDAFWQPQLRTNENGEARFQVTYPDDITSWNAHFIAVGNKKQTDKKQMTIRSFKALTVRLSTPQFAIWGDSLNAVGRIANHYGDSISVTRTIEADKQQDDKLRILTSHVDNIPVQANEGDSLTIAYSLRMENGYFDGEQRSLPILEQGMLQTYGEFKVINDSATHLFPVNPELGPVTVHIEASSLDLFLREIEKVDLYPYMCNEQMASKIKVLLSKKRIATLFNREFKEDDKIKSLINQLTKNRNTDGFWGWWNVGRTEHWISRHVVSALLDAEEAGYKTNLNISTLSYSLEQELESAIHNLKLAVPGRIPYAKKELLERLINLKRLNAPMDYEACFRSIDAQLKNHTLTDKFKTMHALAVIGLKNEVNVDSLMHYASKTMLGSIYWGEKETGSPLYRHFMLPYGNNIDNTLMAYHILKEIGGYEDELTKIRNYFFECRKGGSWQNTYESSRIIETIMPDMLGKDEAFIEASASLNGSRVTQFPYTTQMEPQAPVQIRKLGTAPLFTTVYQQGWNNSPVRESGRGFTVKTEFTVNKDTVSYLTAGEVARLSVSVTVEADAEYVQIEVPIPAGCSYDSKNRGNYWKEIHREHFKEKVVIFSHKLTKGEHLFTIDLIPRYTGQYSLNPAKAELMYFPTFYGNEDLKTIRIE